MNTNNDRNLIIVKYVKLVDILEVAPGFRTDEQLKELKTLKEEIERLKAKIGKQPTKNMFTGYVAKVVEEETKIEPRVYTSRRYNSL